MARRALATSTATPHDASLVITESARLVRMIGTRAPSTMPAASAPARNDRPFRQHAAGLEVRYHQHVRTACDRRVDLLDLYRLEVNRVIEPPAGRRLIAPVIWPRSAILHSAAASIVDGTFGLTVSIADRIATHSAKRSACARSIAFWMM